MRILFLTWREGSHLAGDKEFDRLRKGFANLGMYLARECEDPDILLVRAFSHAWGDLAAYPSVPVVYYSVGAEWRVGEDHGAVNEPIEELYRKADAVVHLSEYCRFTHHKLFPHARRNGVETVIPTACEPRLPFSYPERGPGDRLRLAATCTPRPVKRVEEQRRLARKFGFELVEALGGVTDFSYYHQCDGFLHLSRKEGMPNAVLEALSYGLPCLVTNYGGAKEAVGDAGVVVRNDPEGVPWDPNHIEPVDDGLFEAALNEFQQRLPELRMRVRRRVLT